jgi:ADP-heptose:LPS heptosyltransferase
VPRFLIVRFSSIGDIVLTSPVIRSLKAQVPGAEVHYLTRKAYRHVLEHDLRIDKLWCTDGGISDVISELKAQRFDAVIDLHHNLRSLKLKRRLSVPSYSFPKLNIEKWLLVNLHINRMPAVHIVDRYMSTLKPFGVHNDGQGLDFYTHPEARSVLERLPSSHRNGFIAIAIGAQHSTKIMPSEKIAHIAKLTGLPVVLLGGKEDRIRGAQIELILQQQAWNTCGHLTLGESAELIRASRVVLSHDTGLMHIAAAFRKPIVSVWGNTVPSFGMTPYMPGEEHKSTQVEVEGLRCRPCTKIGYDRCPKGHFDCIRTINDQRVAAALTAAWSL